MENARMQPRVRKLGEPVDGADRELPVLNERALLVEALRSFARAMGCEVV